MLEYQVSFFFSALGVFNGILAWIYLQFFKRPRTVSHTIGCLILLMFCIRVGVSCIYFFHTTLAWDYVQLGLTAHFLLGPLLYTFVYLRLSPDESRVNHQILHHILINALIIISLGLIFPFRDHAFIWDHRIRYVIHAHVTIYILLTTFLLRPVIRKALKERLALHKNEFESLAVFSLFLLICLGFVVSLYTNYILGPVFTSIIFYALSIVILTRRNWIRNTFYVPRRYANKKIDTEKAADLKRRLQKVMLEKQLYKQPNLKIEDIAKQLDVPTSLVSQFLNDNLGMNGPTYINVLRIEEAKKLLLSKSHEHFTIEAIGYEVGFNTKSSFYTSFKKHTKTTPRLFRAHSNRDRKRD